MLVTLTNRFNLNSTFTSFATEHHLLVLQIVFGTDPSIGQKRRLVHAYRDTVQMLWRVKDHRAGHIDPLMVFRHSTGQADIAFRNPPMGMCGIGTARAK